MSNIPGRYPNGHPAGAPFEHYGSIQSEEAIRYAGAILEFVRLQEVCFQLWRELERVITEWPLDVRSLEEDEPFSRRVSLKGEVIYERALAGS